MIWRPYQLWTRSVKRLVAYKRQRDGQTEEQTDKGKPVYPLLYDSGGINTNSTRTMNISISICNLDKYN
jgi:hypothetical protein